MSILNLKSKSVFPKIASVSSFKIGGKIQKFFLGGTPFVVRPGKDLYHYQQNITPEYYKPLEERELDYTRLKDKPLQLVPPMDLDIDPNKFKSHSGSMASYVGYVNKLKSEYYDMIKENPALYQYLPEARAKLNQINSLISDPSITKRLTNDFENNEKYRQEIKSGNFDLSSFVLNNSGRDIVVFNNETRNKEVISLSEFEKSQEKYTPFTIGTLMKFVEERHLTNNDGAFDINQDNSLADLAGIISIDNVNKSINSGLGDLGKTSEANDIPGSVIQQGGIYKFVTGHTKSSSNFSQLKDAIDGTVESLSSTEQSAIIREAIHKGERISTEQQRQDYIREYVSKQAVKRLSTETDNSLSYSSVTDSERGDLGLNEYSFTDLLANASTIKAGTLGDGIVQLYKETDYITPRKGKDFKKPTKTGDPEQYYTLGEALNLQDGWLTEGPNATVTTFIPGLNMPIEELKNATIDKNGIGMAYSIPAVNGGKEPLVQKLTAENPELAKRFVKYQEGYLERKAELEKQFKEVASSKKSDQEKTKDFNIINQSLQQNLKNYKESAEKVAQYAGYGPVTVSNFKKVSIQLDDDLRDLLKDKRIIGNGESTYMSDEALRGSSIDVYVRSGATSDVLTNKQQKEKYTSDELNPLTKKEYGGTIGSRLPKNNFNFKPINLEDIQ